VLGSDRPHWRIFHVGSSLRGPVGAAGGAQLEVGDRIVRIDGARAGQAACTIKRSGCDPHPPPPPLARSPRLVAAAWFAEACATNLKAGFAPHRAPGGVPPLDCNFKSGGGRSPPIRTTLHLFDPTPLDWARSSPRAPLPSPDLYIALPSRLTPPHPPSRPFYSEIELRVAPDPYGAGAARPRERTVVVRRTRPVEREVAAPDAARFRAHLAETGFWLQAQPGDEVDRERLADELERHTPPPPLPTPPPPSPPRRVHQNIYCPP
jgi:hypothetical protein